MWIGRLSLILAITIRLLVVAENLIDIYHEDQNRKRRLQRRNKDGKPRRYLDRGD